MNLGLIGNGGLYLFGNVVRKFCMNGKFSNVCMSVIVVLVSILSVVVLNRIVIVCVYVG